MTADWKKHLLDAKKLRAAGKVEEAKRAFTAFAEPAQQDLLPICWRELHDIHWVENAFQETFIAVWNALAEIEPERNVEAWVKMIGRNKAIDIAKKEKLRRMQSLFDHEIAGNEMVSEAEMREQESGRYSRIENVLAQLGEADRKALRSYYLEGTSSEECARLLNTTLAAFQSQRGRARLHFREIWERLYPPKPDG